jgi:hypothetical protein
MPSFLVEADARILHGEPHLIVRASFCSDLHLPRTIVHGAHGVRGVLEQIQDHLLKLDAVPCHHRSAGIFQIVLHEELNRCGNRRETFPPRMSCFSVSINSKL